MVDINSPTADKLRYLAWHIARMDHGQHLNVEPGKHKFNLKYYMTRSPGSQDELEMCGTVCCIAGEAVRRLDPKRFYEMLKNREGRWKDEGIRILGINETDAEHLFYGYFSEELDNDITPKEAAAALRELAEDYE